MADLEGSLRGRLARGGRVRNLTDFGAFIEVEDGLTDSCSL